MAVPVCLRARRIQTPIMFLGEYEPLSFYYDIRSHGSCFIRMYLGEPMSIMVMPSIDGRAIKAIYCVSHSWCCRVT